MIATALMKRAVLNAPIIKAAVKQKDLVNVIVTILANAILLIMANLVNVLPVKK